MGRTLGRRDAAAVIGGGALLAGSAALVMAADDLPALELQAFTAVNALPNRLWPVVWAPMQFGSLAGSLLVAGATTAWWDRRLGRAALVGSQAAYWSAKFVKHVVRRGRPTTRVTDPQLRENATGDGYVSGHSAVAFALAATLAPELPPVGRAAVVTGAFVVGFGRMYSGAHLPLDVVGGVGLGIVVGTLSRVLR